MNLLPWKEKHRSPNLLAGGAEKGSRCSESVQDAQAAGRDDALVKLGRYRMVQRCRHGDLLDFRPCGENEECIDNQCVKRCAVRDLPYSTSFVYRTLNELFREEGVVLSRDPAFLARCRSSACSRSGYAARG